MPTEDLEARRTRINQTVLKYFGLCMALAYIILGGVITAIPKDIFTIAPSQIIAVGVLLIAYGLYRLFKVYRQYFKK